MLTLNEACERVRLSPWAVRRAISRGELDASKPAGRIRISEQAIDDWLKLTKVEPEPDATTAVPLRLVATKDLARTQVDSFRARLRQGPS